jgi:hypothetical protein
VALGIAANADGRNLRDATLPAVLMQLVNECANSTLKLPLMPGSMNESSHQFD